MAPLLFEHVDTVLLDIEGTICPISFVKDTLFPYAINALPEVLSKKWSEPDFKPYRDAFPKEAQASPEAFEAHVKDLTARDVKIAYLKNLQGFLWQAGYESGAYSTPLFDDVAPQLRKWHDASFEIAIYSSGSVFAQKLLFRHVKDASSAIGDTRTIDLSSVVSGWYDTTNAGPKMESASYTKIAGALGKQADKILFLSDNVKEVSAALEAGMKSVVIDRPGNAPLTASDQQAYRTGTSLSDLQVSR